MTDSSTNERAAIEAALNLNWKEAVRINTILLKADKSNINILNRLGFAHMQSGEIAEAKRIFSKVVKLDEYNQIAIKNLKKLGIVKQKDLLKSNTKMMSPLLFLEEPGKTKIVVCVNTAPIAVLSTVSPGEEIILHAKNHAVEIRNEKNVYLGALPDDLAFRIIKFLAGGNTYQALVQAIGKNSLTLFIRELTRGKRFTNQPSFASTGIYVPQSRAERAEDGTEPVEDADADDKED